MFNPWHDIEASAIQPADFLAVIEIPKGSNKKYELDKASGMLRLDRVLYTATHYPANYGFIPRTLSDDGDPLDVLLLSSVVLDPLILVRCLPIGVIFMQDGGSLDEKIIAVPAGDPVYNLYHSIHELPAHIFEEMMHFFAVYKHLEGRETDVHAVEDREAAIRVINETLANYAAAFPERSR